MPAAPDVAPDDDRHAWERPGAFEVGPGVWRIPLPLPGDALKAVNVYAIPDGDRVVLVDGGWTLDRGHGPAGAGLLRRSATGSATSGTSYVTHMHRDHYTHAIALRRRFGGTVSLGEGERTALEIVNGSEFRQPNVARMREAGATEIAREIESLGGSAPTTPTSAPTTRNPTTGWPTASICRSRPARCG